MRKNIDSRFFKGIKRIMTGIRPASKVIVHRNCASYGRKLFWLSILWINHPTLPKMLDIAQFLTTLLKIPDIFNLLSIWSKMLPVKFPLATPTMTNSEIHWPDILVNRRISRCKTGCAIIGLKVSFLIPKK